MLGHWSAESRFILKLRLIWFHAANINTGSVLPKMSSRWPCEDVMETCEPEERSMMETCDGNNTVQ